MSLEKLTKGGFSIGVELPLDNDWSVDGDSHRRIENRPFGVPDMKHHAERVQLADRLGFRAAWVRDVPIYDPHFGDAAQVFEIFTYLGYLAAQTKEILLGSAAVVLPLRNPWLVRKAAASVQALSNQRLMLGVASGDRPSEYPIFDVEYDRRGELFIEAVQVLEGLHDDKLAEGMAVLPTEPAPPLLVAGLAQQTPQWAGEHMQGWLAYPGTPDDHKRRVALWRSVAGNKPYVSFIHLDLIDQSHAPVKRHRFGISTGIEGLIQELESMKAAGVDHIGLQFRRNQRPLDVTMHDIAEFVLPHFHN